MNTPKILSWIVAGFTLLAIAWGLYYGTSHLLFPNGLVIPNQEIRDSILVSSIKLSSPKGGFLIIYKEAVTEKVDRIFVTQSQYLTPGTYTNVWLPLLPEPDVNETTLAGSALIGLLYEDTDGNTVLEEIVKDKPLRTIVGKPIEAVFQDTFIPSQSQ